MDIVGSSYSFNRNYFRKFGNILPACDTAADNLAVEDNIAHSALPAVTAPFCACQLKLVSYYGKERCFGLAYYPARHPVDCDIFYMVH